jgi:uncharacterized membrane protein (DUF485 family)
VYNPQREPAMKSAPDAASRRRLDEAEWNRIANSAKFQDLLAVKKIFIIPAFVFFLAYYLLLPVLVGYAPKFMSTPVIGSVTLAYVFALSQFAVGWTIAWLYLKASARFDELVKDMLEQSVADKEDECRSRL